MRGLVAGFLLCAAACQDGRRVDVLIGPDEATLSKGFTCLQTGTIMPMALRGWSAGTLEFQVVVDLITLGGIPGCRGEEIIAWCAPGEHDCVPIVVEQRFCATVRLTGLSLADLSNIEARIAEIYAQLRAAGPVVVDAPDEPLLVRAVATAEGNGLADPCAGLTAVTAGRYAPFDPAALMGCAYSCPVLLDAVDTAVQLGFDGARRDCEVEVGICAGNLRP